MGEDLTFNDILRLMRRHREKSHRCDADFERERIQNIEWALDALLQKLARTEP